MSVIGASISGPEIGTVAPMRLADGSFAAGSATMPGVALSAMDRATAAEVLDLRMGRRLDGRSRPAHGVGDGRREPGVGAR
jgi:hypothetical protein